MSQLPGKRRHKRYNFTNEAAAGAILLLLFVAGALAMLPVAANVARVWTDDPLRSFGALLPLVSVALCVWRWREQDWQSDGTLWGAVPATVAILVARTYGSSLIAYGFGDTEFEPIQPGLLAFAYGSGVLLLLGGVRLWRAALFPLGLLLCVNPVPHLFERVDFPLQQLSANVARGFAHLLGLYPTGEQLQMMFAPRFGMVIVPGCNGLRGSATMAYLALFIAAVRRYRWLWRVLYAVAGLLLGYVLNLLRLCCLVVYYRLGMHHDGWRGDGALVDYCIGGTIFLLVTTAAGFLLLRPDGQPRRQHVSGPIDWGGRLAHPRWIVVLLVLLAAAGSEVPSAWAMLAHPSDYIPAEFALSQMPADAGTWHRGKNWTEVYNEHPVWQWATYRATDGRVVDVGLWLSPKRHFAIQSRMMNGSQPVTGGSFQAGTADGVPMQLASFTLNDVAENSSVATPTFFAETMCLPDHCSEEEIGFSRRGWIVALTPQSARMERRLPMLFRVQTTGEWKKLQTQESAKRAIRDLTASLRLTPMVQQMGSR